jgi:hypothetical protein
MAALVFGPDAGLVQERAETLMKSVVPDLTDPFNVADLERGRAAGRSGAAGDEAAAISMMGGRRVVRVRGAGNDLAKLFDPSWTIPRRCAGGGGRRRSGQAPRAAQAVRGPTRPPPPSPAIPTRARPARCGARCACAPKGFPSRPMRWKMRCRGWARDRGVTRREMEKLALYMHGQKAGHAGRCARRDGRRGRGPQRKRLRCGGQMLKVRVIPCLDVKDGRVVKGVNFVDLRDAGDPVEQAIAYDAAGADELCFLDITATHENRGTCSMWCGARPKPASCR